MDPRQVTALVSGQILDDYRIDRYRGSGAFAHVFDAEHLSSGRRVVLKILDPAAGTVEHREFDNEGDLLQALLRASAVVDIYGTGQASIPVTVLVAGTPSSALVPLRFHVLERADLCLDEILIHRLTLDWGAKLTLYRQAVLGIHQMHLAHVAHRDCKSANCLIFQRSQSNVDMKISDLGRARDLRQAGTARAIDYQLGRGDPDFAPPEMLWLMGVDSERCHIRADLYGLGSILFEVATGQGITAASLGSAIPFMQRAASWTPKQRETSYRTELPNIQAALEIALSLLENEVPAYLRPHFLQLLRQLCDPDPAKRDQTIKTGRRCVIAADLQWLLRKVDIMIRVHELNVVQKARRAVQLKRRALVKGA